MQNLVSFSTSLDFEPPVFRNVARYLNSEIISMSTDDRCMSSLRLMNLSPQTPENSLEKVPLSLKLQCKNVLSHQ